MTCACAQIGDSGAEVVALGLAANSGLLELSLARNGVRRDGARKLGRALEANTCLTRWVALRALCTCLDFRCTWVR